MSGFQAFNREYEDYSRVPDQRINPPEVDDRFDDFYQDNAEGFVFDYITEHKAIMEAWQAYCAETGTKHDDAVKAVEFVETHYEDWDNHAVSFETYLWDLYNHDPDPSDQY